MINYKSRRNCRKGRNIISVRKKLSAISCVPSVASVSFVAERRYFCGTITGEVERSRTTINFMSRRKGRNIISVRKKLSTISAISAGQQERAEIRLHAVDDPVDTAVEDVICIEVD